MFMGISKLFKKNLKIFGTEWGVRYTNKGQQEIVTNCFLQNFYIRWEV
jgi:hypothetical protein